MPFETTTIDALCTAVANCLSAQKANIPADSVWNTVQSSSLAARTVFVEFSSAGFDDNEERITLNVVYLMRGIQAPLEHQNLRKAAELIYRYIRSDCQSESGYITTLGYFIVPGATIRTYNVEIEDKDQAHGYLAAVLTITFGIPEIMP